MGPVLGGYPMICSCGAVSTTRGDEPLQHDHRAHVAAALREQIVAWLGSEATVEAAAEFMYRKTDVNLPLHDPLDITCWDAANAALSALAEQVGGGES